MSNITVQNKESISVSVTQSGYNKSTVIKQPVKNSIDVSGLVKASADKSYVHSQGVSSNEWTISHNLGKRPSVVIVDSAEDVVYGEVRYIDDNTIRIKFTGGFSGKAYLN